MRVSTGAKAQTQEAGVREGARLENSEVTVKAHQGCGPQTCFGLISLSAYQIPFSISSYDVDDNNKNGVISNVNGNTCNFSVPSMFFT